MKLRKLGYYAESLLQLAAQLRNPWSLLRPLCGRSGEISFCSGLCLELRSALEVLIAAEVCCRDEYELGRLKAPRCIVDVGAGIGEFSVRAAALFPEASVLAFEPDAGRFERLRSNIRRSRVTNVAAFQVAVGDPSASRIPRAQVSGDLPFGRGITAAGGEVRSLSEYVSEAVDLLKIDCEGAELEVLQGMGESLTSKVRSVALEFHDFIEPGLSERAVKRLEGAGFECSLVRDRFASTQGHIFARNHVLLG